MNPVRMVIFDLDGVLLDSEPIHIRSIEEILRRYGAQAPDLAGNVGKSSEDMWMGFIRAYGLDTTPQELVREMTRLDKETMVREHTGASRGLDGLLRTLKKRGVALGLASSSERDFVDWVLHYLGVYEDFAFTAAGTEAPRKKPWPDLYERVLALSGIPACDAAAVEDSAAGVTAAKQAGLRCIGYLNPTSGQQDLSKADVVVSSLADVAGVLFPPQSPDA